jgi:hypothetical protein
MCVCICAYLPVSVFVCGLYMYSKTSFFFNIWGIGFSYTESRFSQNGGYGKLHQKHFFFLLIYLLYYMISLYW